MADIQFGKQGYTDLGSGEYARKVDVVGMSGATSAKTVATGTGAIAASGTVATGSTYQLVSVSIHFDAAPTTSEDLTITLDANAGAAYDLLLYTLDPSASSVTDILWQPDQDLVLEAGDAVDVAYTNSDGNTYGVQITFRVM